MARLSKSRFQTGLNCPRALWLGCRRPELQDPVGEIQQHIFDTGTAVGELARERFAQGVLVAENHAQSARALETTQELLQDPPAALFEAALEFGRVFVRPDVLVRVGTNEWDLYEVKSTTKLKSEHLTDLAIQMWVLEGAGLPIRRAYLMHLDSTYVYGGGAYDLGQLFAADDATQAVRDFLPSVSALVDGMLATLEGPEPQVTVGRQCQSPYRCSFFGYCHANLPEHPVTKLPSIRAGLLDSLTAGGIFAIEDVPDDYPGLTARQRTVRELVRSGEPRIDGDVAASLRPLRYPIHFLDFESFNSALPLVPGTRPWQQVPFQWSDHVLGEGGELDHREFLYDGTDDPRPQFVRSLLETLGAEGSIVVYTSFEATRLRELARDLPHFAEQIDAIQPRLFDLEKVVSAHVRHPDCLGRTSIKVVLPALVPDLTYDELGIAEGQQAALSYVRCLTGSTTGVERDRTLSDLLAYCGTDTMAMVRLFEVLRSSGDQGSAAEASRLPS